MEQEENISPEEKQKILEKRKERFKKMGVPDAGKIGMSANQTAANTQAKTTDPQEQQQPQQQEPSASPQGAKDRRSNLQEVLSGKKKEKFSNLLNAGASKNEFQEMPEPERVKKAKNRGKKTEGQQSSSGGDSPTGFSAKGDTSQAAMMEQMLAPDGKASTPTGGGGSGPDVTQQLDPNDPMAGKTTGDIKSEFKNRIQQKSTQEQETENAPNLMEEKQNMGVPEQLSNKEGGLDYKFLKEMIEDVAEKKIKEVLNEFSKKHENENKFKFVSKRDNIIEHNGKTYRLQPVRVKKKSKADS